MANWKSAYRESKTVLPGRAPRYIITEPTSLMEIPASFLECVAFVAKSDDDGFVGTAFFVEHAEGGVDFDYIVTARHVVEAAGKMGRVALRVNIKNAYLNGLLAKETACFRGIEPVKLGALRAAERRYSKPGWTRGFFTTARPTWQ